jgi:diguanylate cyclase (GGDEF)-like protein
MSRTINIKKLEAEIKRLKHLAYRDELTGLYNRRGFKEEAEKFLGEITRGRKINKRKSVVIKNFSVILFDADHFKKVNDAYGHDTGDLMLKMIAKKIVNRARDMDIVSRWGGEEFLVGLVGASEADALRIAESIRVKIENANLRFGGKTIKLTVSGGVSAIGAGGMDELIARADKALYKAKSGGRNKIVKYSEL